MSDRAKRLEYAGNSGYIEEIKQFTPALLSLYRSYFDKLAPLREVDDYSEEKPEIEPEELEEAYETLREVSASFDYDSLEFVLKSLAEYHLPEKDAAKVKQIKEAANNLDWTKLNDILNSEN